MFVKDWMSTYVVTIDADDLMLHAIRLLKENNIRSLPVLKDGRLVGIVSNTDLKRASASDATLLDVHEVLYLISTIKVKSIMTKEPVTVSPMHTVEETAVLLLNRKISGAPVVDEHGKIVGMITRDDLFRMLISVTGLAKQGVLFGFSVEDRPGSIKEITDVIRNHGGRIAGILISYDRAPAGFRIVYIRAYAIDLEEMSPLQHELERKAVLLSMVDHDQNRREIFLELDSQKPQGA